MWGKKQDTFRARTNARRLDDLGGRDGMTGLEKARHEREEYDSLLEKLRQESTHAQDEQPKSLSETILGDDLPVPPPAEDEEKIVDVVTPVATLPEDDGKGQSAHNEWGELMNSSDNEVLGNGSSGLDTHQSVVPGVNTDSPGPQFYCGPGLKLKGEITGCDTFKVEGDVEGKVSAQHLHLSPTGKFLGTADVQDAAIEGKLEGTLNVAGRLLVRSSGRVSGKIVYGQIEIECGGEILGEVSPRTVGADAEHLNGGEKKSKSNSWSASSSAAS
jgi:cytoskeletal protein CcmA (bactofilin family)